jgi:3-oxoacyl-[acyl-carrier-protein] synthase II
VSRRAVITGCGVVSAVGGSARETWEGLLAGRVGIGPVTLFDTAGERTHLAAEIRSLPATSPGRRGSRGDVLGVAAALAAVEEARLGPDRFEGGRAALLLGGGGTGLLQAEDYVRAARAGPAPAPSSALGFLASVTADRIASRLGFRGPCATLMNACSSSTVAIGLGALLVRAGTADVVLAGGVETLSRTTFSGFNALRLVDPAPCRPFDRDRRGLSLGECAALLVIEERETALRRGASIVAEIAGVGMSADARHMTAPDPDGAGIARAMRAALADAGLGAGEIDHVNAHGTGTEQNDRAETRAIESVLGERARRVPVVSIKGMVGHCLGAAGAIEAFSAAMALREGVVPPTAGLRNPDPECGLDYVPGRARRVEMRNALSLSLAFGGNNAALLLARHAA